MGFDTEAAPGSPPTPNYDAIIVGGGFSGMYQLYRLRELSMDVCVFEDGGDIGGTWYWNRYPGARFDSESWSYGFSFSEELLQEWAWSEHFAAQPDTLRYLNYVADKFDLRRDMRFDSRVVAAHFDDAATRWTITLENGEGRNVPRVLGYNGGAVRYRKKSEEVAAGGYKEFAFP